MKKYLMFLFVAFVVGLASCSKDDVEPNEEELITTLKVSLLAAGSTTPEVFTFKDIDGPAGNPPSQFDSIIIDANKSYTATLQFLNESVSPAEDVTVEIATEAEDHQVYFTPAGVSITPSNLNLDSKGLPVGITSTWQTGAAAKGTLTITLIHKPGIKAAGDPISKGETDVEVAFGVRLK
ncbi:MAG: hypothetical protein WBP58_02220 [Chitinophagaceae bacterium]